MLGWVLFGVAMFVFVFVANALSKFSVFKSVQQGDDSPVIAAPPMSSATGARMLAVSMMAVIALGLGPAIAFTRVSEVESVAIHDVPAIEIPGWEQVQWEGSWLLDYQRGDASRKALYRDAQGQQVYFYSEYFARQSQDREAVNILNRVYDGEHWLFVHEGEVQIPEGSWIEETLVRSPDGEERLVWRWYYTGGKITGNRFWAKIYNVWATLHNDPAILVVITSVEINESQQQARARLARFFGDSVGPVTRPLGV
jgi:EpsI family protein